MKVLSTVARLRMRPDIRTVSAMIQNILLAPLVALGRASQSPGKGKRKPLDGGIKFIR